MHTMKHMGQKQNRKERPGMEKAYLTMKNGGMGSIVIGIIVLAVGITAGILSIVNGACLLKNKREITF